jgi:DNA topoisomerase-3
VHHVKNAAPKKFISESKPLTTAEKKSSAKKDKEKSDKAEITSMACPKCSKGKIIKGNKAFGCNEYKSGCTFLLPFEFHSKKISEAQFISLIKSGKTSSIKGFIKAGEEIEAIVKLDKDFNLFLEEKESDQLVCPKCNKGEIIIGKTSYGCSEWKAGCNFRVPLSYYGKEINKKHLTSLVAGKETSTIKGFTKEGVATKLNGKLRFGKDFGLDFIKV